MSQKLFHRKCLGTVAIPGGVPAMFSLFVEAYGKMCAYNAEILCNTEEYVHNLWTTKSFHAAARNELVENARGEWIFMCDTDHWFEPDLTSRMLDRLNTYQCDVVVGFYTFKSPPYLPVLYQFNDRGKGHPIAAWEENGNDLVQVDAAGGGCLMCRMSVFHRIAVDLGEQPFDSVRSLGEDMSFFERLKRLGIKVYLDPRVESHHLEIRKTGYADYKNLNIGFKSRRKGEAVAQVDTINGAKG